VSVTPGFWSGWDKNRGTICDLPLPHSFFTQTRALCQRDREQLPENRILIGLWQSPKSEMMRERLAARGRTRQ